LGETMYLGYTHYFKSAILSILIYFIILKWINENKKKLKTHKDKTLSY
jgi:tellurite resistance protein TehA-like permease